MTNTVEYSNDDAIASGMAGIARSWGLVLLGGLIAIGFGAALLAWPEETLQVVAVLVGIWLFVAGVVQIVASFGHGISGGSRALFAIAGILSLIIGAALVKNIISDESGSTARALALLSILIGAGWLVNGVARLVAGISSPAMPGRGWEIAAGVIGIIAAIVVLAWPLGSLAVLATVVGIMLLVIGAFEVVGAFVLRGARAKA